MGDCQICDRPVNEILSQRDQEPSRCRKELCAGRQKSCPKEKIRVVYELGQKYKLVSLLKLSNISKSSYFYEISSYNKLDKDYEIKNGYIEVPSKPGLGVELDEDALQDKIYDGQWVTPRLTYEDGSIAEW